MAVEDTEDSAAAAQGRWFDAGLENIHSQQGGETHSAVAAVEKGVEQAPDPGLEEWRFVKTWSEIVRWSETLVVYP